MEIIRPYKAEDNETNKDMREIIERYVSKIGENIQTMEIYGLSVKAMTESGNVYQISQADGCKVGTTYNQRHFFYMNKIVDGKRKRIKKEEWV